MGMNPTPAMDDRALDELLGAYALDACEPADAAAVEEYLRRDASAADEVMRLRNAAVWIGATEMLRPPDALRASVLDEARARRRARRHSEAIELYEHEIERFDALVQALDSSVLDVRAPNGLRAGDLVAHMAAMESMLAAEIGHPTAPDVTVTDPDARTAIFIERYHDDLHGARRAWRESVDALLRWARTDGAVGGVTIPWFGVALPRADVLVGRAFETWIHADDLRRAQALPLAPPPANSLRRMGELSARVLQLALVSSGQGRPGSTARLVLTGEGGGSWTVPCGPDEIVHLSDVPALPDVTVTADVVEWCLMVGERVDARDLSVSVAGDRELGAALIAVAPAFATV